MEAAEVVRVIQGLIKKHDKNFSVNLKYKTASSKIRKRHGDFVELIGDAVLVLYNSDKKAEGRYEVDRIVEIRKRT